MSEDSIVLFNSLIDRRDRLLESIDECGDDTEEYLKLEKELGATLDQLGAVIKQDVDAEERKKDRDSKLQIEKMRNEGQESLERIKQSISWKRAAFEMAKVMAPVIFSGLLYFSAQDRILDFEEHGRITSTAGRELHLPNIFKWR